MLGARVEFINADGTPISIDAGHVFAVLPNPQGDGGTLIASPMGYAYLVRESYAVVIEALRKAMERH